MAQTQTRASPSTNIRVAPATHQRLKGLAERLDTSIAQIVSDAIDAYERRLFGEQFRRDVAALKANPGAWAEHWAELALWDTAASDGLEEEEEDWSAWSGWGAPDEHAENAAQP
jgi:predicted transcriptional regulator